MKRLLVTLLLFFSIVYLSFADTEVSNSVSADTTFELARSPYLVTTGITIASGVTLTIESGVVLKMSTGTIIYVNGNLVADGVTFTSAEASPAAGDWGYIRVGSPGLIGHASLVNSQVLYATKLSLYAGNATLNNTTISNCSEAGVSMEYYLYDTLSMSNCIINNCPLAVRMDIPGHLIFDGTNDLTGNDQDVIRINFNTLGITWRLPAAPVPYYFNMSIRLRTQK